MDIGIFSPTVLLVFISTILVYIYLRLKQHVGRSSSSKQTIPGPVPTDPQTGNFPDIAQAGSLYEYLRIMHAKYGDVVQIWFGTKAVVSTASPNAFKEQIRLFDKPEMSFLSPVFGDRSIQFVNGEEAKQRRKNYDAFLSQEYVHDYFAIFRQVADEMVDHLKSQSRAIPINIYDAMFHTACKAVGICLFGEYFKHDINVKNFKTLYDEFWPVLEKNFTHGLPEPGTDERQHFDKVVQRVHDVVKDMIAEHKAHYTERKFIDIVLETGLDETTIYGDILVYLVGGFHSVSTTLTWCMYHAALYPDVQTEIFKEVSRTTDHQELNIKATAELRYLRQFINESLRLRFVAPVAIRLSEDNTVIAGYKIPPRTHIIQAICVVLTSEKIWGNPDRFCVHRFDSLEVDRRTVSNFDKRSPLAFCPFGFAGKRMCPGKHFFYTEALVVLGSLFKSFKFDLSQETPEDVPVVYGLLTRPGVDIMLTVTDRN